MVVEWPLSVVERKGRERVSVLEIESCRLGDNLCVRAGFRLVCVLPVGGVGRVGF